MMRQKARGKFRKTGPQMGTDREGFHAVGAIRNEGQRRLVALQVAFRDDDERLHVPYPGDREVAIHATYEGFVICGTDNKCSMHICTEDLFMIPFAGGLSGKKGVSREDALDLSGRPIPQREPVPNGDRGHVGGVALLQGATEGTGRLGADRPGGGRDEEATVVDGQDAPENETWVLLLGEGELGETYVCYAALGEDDGFLRAFRRHEETQS